MAWFLRAWGLCLGGALLVACGSKFEEQPSGAGGSASGGSGTGVASGGSGGSGGVVDDGCPMGQRRAYPVPDNWQGPMQVASSAEVDTLPDCMGNQATLHDGAMGDPAVCPCSCEPPQNAACRGIITNHEGDATCMNAGTQLVSVSMQCTNSPAATGPAHVGVSTEVLPSACNANGGGAQLAPATWSTNLRICEVEATPGPGGQCLPAPPAPFERKWCVFRGGDQTCPEGYSDKHVYYADFDDTRDCSGSCSCDVGGVSCSGTLNRYSLANCSTSLGSWAPGSCNSVTTFPLSYDLVNVSMSGVCTPVPAASIGGVSGKNPGTVCCTP